MKNVTQLSEAIDAGLATLAHNIQPAGWRRAEFREVSAYLSPDCPDLLGEGFPDSDTFCSSPREWAKIVAKQMTIQGKTVAEFEASARCDTYTLDLQKKMVIEEMTKSII